MGDTPAPDFYDGAFAADSSVDEDRFYAEALGRWNPAGHLCLIYLHSHAVN